MRKVRRSTILEVGALGAQLSSLAPSRTIALSTSARCLGRIFVENCRRLAIYDDSSSFYPRTHTHTAHTHYALSLSSSVSSTPLYVTLLLLLLMLDSHQPLRPFIVLGIFTSRTRIRRRRLVLVSRSTARARQRERGKKYCLQSMALAHSTICYRYAAKAMLRLSAWP